MSDLVPPLDKCDLDYLASEALDADSAHGDLIYVRGLLPLFMRKLEDAIGYLPERWWRCGYLPWRDHALRVLAGLSQAKQRT